MSPKLFNFGAAQDTKWSVETIHVPIIDLIQVVGRESVSANNSWTVTVGAAGFQIVWSGSTTGWSHLCMCTAASLVILVEDRDVHGCSRVNGFKSLWNLADVEVAATDQPIALHTCDVSLSVDTGTSNLNPNAEAQKLDLNILSWGDLSTQARPELWY